MQADTAAGQLYRIPAAFHRKRPTRIQLDSLPRRTGSCRNGPSPALHSGDGHPAATVAALSNAVPMRALFFIENASFFRSKIRWFHHTTFHKKMQDAFSFFSNFSNFSSKILWIPCKPRRIKRLPQLPRTSAIRIHSYRETAASSVPTDAVGAAERTRYTPERAVDVR